jgi:hypothetical protein
MIEAQATEVEFFAIFLFSMLPRFVCMLLGACLRDGPVFQLVDGHASERALWRKVLAIDADCGARRCSKRFISNSTLLDVSFNKICLALREVGSFHQQPLEKRAPT